MEQFGRQGLRVALMYFLSGKPRYFYSGVDSTGEFGRRAAAAFIARSYAARIFGIRCIRNKRSSDTRGKPGPKRRPRRKELSWLEPISKSPKEDNEAGELNEAKEVLWMIFPSDEDPTLPLDPGEEAFDQPAPQEASQAAPVLRRRFRSVRAVRRDHLDAILT